MDYFEAKKLTRVSIHPSIRWLLVASLEVLGGDCGAMVNLASPNPKLFLSYYVEIN